ncbi:MAG: imidazole glycerol phosphate synthase subunit HisH [Lachnospiraceae bacterium]|nr:imidazole glycerol phosphate synthase subunit HisH [Lachnospiraceae bacterium]
MIAIIDYDAGNMKSVEKALHFLEQEVIVTDDPQIIGRADHVILPGVGAFGMAMQELRARNLEPVIGSVVRAGTPFLGVSLCLQLLFEESEENPGVKGLGLLKGRIRKIPQGEYEKIPHMGWNSLKIRKKSRLFAGIDDDPFVYFVHSYYLKADDPSVVAATTEYNVTIDAAVETDNVFACQFHPEKSSSTGLQILRNFVNIPR